MQDCKKIIQTIDLKGKDSQIHIIQNRLQAKHIIGIDSNQTIIKKSIYQQHLTSQTYALSRHIKATNNRTKREILTTQQEWEILIPSFHHWIDQPENQWGNKRIKRKYIKDGFNGHL